MIVSVLDRFCPTWIIIVYNGLNVYYSMLQNKGKIFVVNKRLRNLRRGANLTQSELAQVLGVTSATVGKYERGDLEPNNEIILKLADYFHCTTDYLLGRTNKPQYEAHTKLPEAITKLGITEMEILKGAEITSDDIKFFEDAAKALRLLKILRTKPEPESDDGGQKR